MRHGANDGLPGGEFMGAELASDILEGNDPLVRAVHRKFRDGDLEVQRPGGPLHAHERSLARLEEIEARVDRQTAAHGASDGRTFVRSLPAPDVVMRRQ